MDKIEIIDKDNKLILNPVLPLTPGRNDDDFSDRLSHWWTTVILIICAAIVGTQNVGKITLQTFTYFCPLLYLFSTHRDSWPE